LRLVTHETRGGGAESPGEIQVAIGILWNHVERVGKPDKFLHASFIFYTYKFTNEQSVLKTQALFLLVALQVLLVVLVQV